MEITQQKFQHVFASNFFVKPQDVHPRKTFTKDFKMTPAEFVALVAFVENAFDIEIPDAELANIHTVRDMIACIGKYDRIKA